MAEPAPSSLQDLLDRSTLPFAAGGQGAHEGGRVARLLADLCEVVQEAHDEGLQHRNLKPSNIFLDNAFLNDKKQPTVTDFEFTADDPGQDPGFEASVYKASEQLRPMQPIDGRADVYALGVILYELLCGKKPPPALDDEAVLLPGEINDDVPEPLQAIALKAMERDVALRYASAHEMARDLRRFLDGRPVLARPSAYGDALERHIRPHLDDIREWIALKLLHPHEADRLRQEYGRLRNREDDWIVESRRLTPAQLALNLGPWFFLLGALAYFATHRLLENANPGLIEPLLFLGLPFGLLMAGGNTLERREHRAAAMSCFLASALILPFFLVLLFYELGLWPPAENDFLATVSNRQLQVAMALACFFAYILAQRTRGVALGTVFTAWTVVLALTINMDKGLEGWLRESRWDLLALHLLPLVPLMALFGFDLERHGHRHLARPLYIGTGLVLVATLEALALDGRALGYLGLSFQNNGVLDPTLAAMTLNGLVIYLVAYLVHRWGTDLRQRIARPLLVLAPFLVLAPSSYGFYLFSRRQGWLETTGFAATIVAAGLLTIGLGVLLDYARRARSTPD